MACWSALHSAESSLQLLFISTCYVPAAPKVFILVKEDVEDQKSRRGEVVSLDCHQARKLSLILHIKPCAEQNNSCQAIQSCLQKQENKVQSGQRISFCSIPVKVHHYYKYVKDVS